MSKYEWEKGEFKIPSAEWSELKSRVREAMNKSNLDMFDAAVALYDRVAARVKGIKNADLEHIAWDEIEKLYPDTYYRPSSLTDSEKYDVVHTVVSSEYKNGKTKTRLRKPLKKDFPRHGNNVTEFSNSDCIVTFDNASRTVVWNVPENNHACERARATALGKAFFSALGRVAWTRGTGGTIIGNDEYNQDAGRDYAGGGGSYSKDSYGPDVKPKHGSSAYGSGFGRRW